MTNEKNTITAFHCWRRNGELKVKPRPFKWHIPKRLRGQIQQGDIVLVESQDKKKPVLVIDVSREELEETGRYYKRVIKMLDRVDKRDEQPATSVRV
ncbi:DUF5839 family protein [Bacillus sp. FSL K6-4563]|uniref:DUF5839 family protein n=1 Tax=Bacillus TaxID=1386 RepID=UPI000557F8A8|nr:MULTISPECIES: DUF5839 family protein [Bacillus]MBR0591366.1 hypothetical protein [Bacillus pumilus sxm20-2]MCP1527702.1 hypothetical protein [Bacillus pumilus]MCR4354861.1 DUF5839 family protein [Bacillus pumilus]MCY7507264.1 DUF5839 family protein [Bacillus pumilus]MCY7576678.1 DUF5839 family protein [Bacillus pumilus]